MVRLRSKGCLSIPPPCYHPDSSSVTLSIYYGGKAESEHYVGGAVRKLDFVDVDKLTFSNIDEYVQDLFPEGRPKRIFTAVHGGFRTISIEEDLRAYGRKYLKKTREYPIFVEKLDESTEKRVNVDEGVRNPEDGAGEKQSTDRKGGKSIFSENEIEFLTNAEPTQEWVDEYERRYGKNSGNLDGSADPENGNLHKNEDSGKTESTDSEETENGGDETEDGGDETEDGGDEIVSDSEDFDYNVDGNEPSSQDDDDEFEDNVSSGAEIGKENSDESDGSSVSLGDYCEDVVGADDGYLDLNRLSDEEGEVNSFKPFNENNIYDPDFDIGQVFKNKQIFKKSVTSYAIKTRRTLPCRRSDSRRVYVRCSEDRNGCPFKINAIKAVNTAPENKDAFVVRELCLEHTCDEGWDVKNLKSQWLAEKYVSWFKSDPKRSVMGFKEDVEDLLLVTISKDQAYRAKQKATKMLQGNPDLQYTRLWDYANELRKTNPGSTVILGTDEIEGEKRFSKFYVCFNAMKEGFKSCRPMIGIDGCHLKGPHGGILLTAVGVDPDNSIFPLSYAVVSSETKDNWVWFFSVLRADLELGSGKDFTFISDKQKGLVYALPEVFPAAEQRFCVRHMIVNLNSAGPKGFALKNAIWKAAFASTVSEFKAAMRAIRDKFPDAANWLQDKHPSEWSKSHFLETSKCDQLLNNSCESFNSSILEARNKPIITMLEWIREYLMKKWNLSRETAEKWEGVVCPTIAGIVRELGKKVGGCRPIKASKVHFQVQTVDGQYAIDLVSRTCSCRMWQLSGIPCMHALSVMKFEKLDALDFVDQCYHVTSYKNAYAGVVMPISGQDVWGDTLFIPPLPPNFGRKPGRPSKLRKRGIDEPEKKRKAKKRGPIIRKMRRIQKTIHCGVCGEPGHNALLCDSLPDSAKQKLERLTRRAFEAVGESMGDEVHQNATHADEEVHEDILPPAPQVEEMTEQVSEPIGSGIPPFTISDLPTSQGPSMYEQLQMGNSQRQTQVNRSILTVEGVQQAAKQDWANKKKKAKKTLGVRMRVPPTLDQESQVLTQQSVSSSMQTKKIVVKSGKKYLQLSETKD